jgi:hypothetical protein
MMHGTMNVKLVQFISLLYWQRCCSTGVSCSHGRYSVLRTETVPELLADILTELDISAD